MNCILRERLKLCLVALTGLWFWADRADAEIRVGNRLALEEVPVSRVDTNCRDDFLELAPKGWQSISQFLQGFEVEVTHIEEWEDRFQSVRRQRSDWIACKPTDSSLLLVSEQATHEVAVANERYSFQVRRNTENDAFALMKVEAWPRGGKQPLVGPLDSIHELFNRSTSIWWVPCEYIVANLGDAGFEIVSVSYVKTSPECQVARIAFRYHGEPRNSPPCIPGAIYWGEFCPEKHWAVVRGGVVGLLNGNEQLKILVETSYQDWLEEACFPRTTIMAYEDITKMRIVEVKNTTFGRPFAEMRSREQFYLPYYGISEAIAFSPGTLGTHWRLILNILAIAALLIAIFLRKYGGKRMAVTCDGHGAA